MSSYKPLNSEIHHKRMRTFTKHNPMLLYGTVEGLEMRMTQQSIKEEEEEREIHNENKSDMYKTARQFLKPVI